MPDEGQADPPPPTRGNGSGGGDAERDPGAERPGTPPEADRPRTLMEFRGTPAPAAPPPVDSVAPTQGPPATHPSATASAGSAPRAVGPYQILSEIGRGGMGVVYKAYHPGLKRTVALKLMIAGQDASEDAIARFHREAEAVARLGHHPNIVPVYDIGQVDGSGGSSLHYFAMHFVEGRSLDRVIDQGGIPPRQAAAVARKVAEALQHAHAHGILHRDIKPANILLAQPDSPDGASRQTDPPDRKGGTRDTGRGAHSSEATPDVGPRSGESGEWVPMLTDFGLAKDVQSDSRMTRSGMTLGTPAYMSPEQADGRVRDIDARSDVYSLGATLYEMLTSLPPFEGESVAGILKKVLFDDPRPPRKANPAVDPDLETICLKCLEKEPSRRYPFAADLAADLDRYLRGEAITARPVGVAGKLLRRARRHPRAVAAGAAVLVLLAAAAAAGTLQVARSEREKRAEAGKARDSEDRAAAAEARRAGEELRRRRGEKVAKVLMAAQARLFRTHAELKASFYDSSRTPQDRRAAFAPRGKDLEAFFAPFLAADAGPGADPVAAAQRAVALALEGWFTRLGGDEDAASARFREARRADPGVGWGYLFEAMAWLSEYFSRLEVPPHVISPTRIRFHAERPENEPAQRARKGFEEALDALLRASAASEPVWGAELSPGFSNSLAALRGLRDRKAEDAETALTALLSLSEFFWVEEEILQARSGLRYVLGDFEGGLADALRFLGPCPAWAPAHQRAGDFRLGLGRRRANRGQDARPLYREAIRDFDRAASLQPGNPDNLGGRGAAWGFLAEAEDDAGNDLIEAWNRAIEDLDAVVRMEPSKDLSAWNNRAVARLSRGEILERAGRDPEPDYARALEELDEALRRWPGFVEARAMRFQAVLDLASFRAGRGEDPRERCRSVLREAEAMLGTEGPDGEVLATIARAWTLLAEAQAQGGEDPRPSLEQAQQAASRALASRPESFFLRIVRGNANQKLGLDRSRRGEDPSQAYRAALDDYAEALKSNPSHAMARFNLGLTYQYLGDWQAGRGEEPGEAWGRAVQEYGEALKLHPAHADLWSNRAYALQSLAADAARRRKDPFELLRRAIDDYGESLARNPNKARTHHNRGSALQALGEAEQRAGRDPREAFRGAVRDLGAAVRLEPGWAPAWSNRGVAGHMLGSAEAAHGEDPATDFETAARDFAEAARLEPSLWQARAGRGLLLEEMGRYGEARAELDAAAALTGGGDAALAEWQARVRAKAALPPWQQRLERAGWRVGAGWWAGALASYEEALGMLASEGPEAAEAARALRLNAYYNLACMHSLVSTGRRGRLAAGAAPEPGQAEAHRRAAVENLRRAFELGWNDLEQIRKDTDLDPVRETPEFRELLEQWKGKAAGGK